MIGIYGFRNKINNKWYIGQSIDIKTRVEHHIWEGKNGNLKRHFYRALKKYGIENFEIITIEECTEDKLNEREAFWINYYDSYNNGYNKTLGGDGVSGLRTKGYHNKPHTQQTKDKISNSSKGRIPWNKGKHNIYSEETLLKISKGAKGNKNATGHKCSEEAIEKNRQSHLGKSPGNKGKKRYITEDGKISYK